MKTKKGLVKSSKFSGHQRLIILLLALAQFAVILDFMVISPLGDILMKSLEMTPGQFAFSVSSYAFSAAFSGILTAGFADKFDRKKLLLFFFLGFILGTLLCALAENYAFLIFARIITGLFGGVIGSISLTIVADLFPQDMRGRAMGIMQTGFAASQVLGIPVGLYLASIYSWHAPFFMIVVLGFAVAVLIFLFLEPVDKHLATVNKQNLFHRYTSILANQNYLKGFMLTATVYIGGFLMQPFASAFFINNLKISPAQLPLIFLISGLSSLIVMPVVGKLSDKINKFKLFSVGSIWAMLFTLIYVNLPIVPLWILVLVNILLFIGIMSRNIPAIASISSIPNPVDRGAFMSLNSSIQQLAGGLAATLSGMIVTQHSHNAKIENFPLLGLISILIMILSIWMMRRVNLIVQENSLIEPLSMPIEYK
jgi:multidrug resistance protein